jgi:hypothetical protein
MFQRFLDYSVNLRNKLDQFYTKVNKSGALSAKENANNLKSIRSIYENKFKESKQVF